ncbi:TadE/TadG family type IV pilus assembly protein [Parvularcula sp. LCG005]|uniref:TadE/TadG family type IV pilus assembly protein n=1 Tax=Parvularcula sp. LCG005 TaxID=3078805 RepID=UPI002942A871|nr:TadE/TadG family type IV pilus assembly protein [Parvularcula sp. LCG005]WOI54042.1 TadE/TadG family type IV pilus assembly protein [Parvularcula sp. LCG005]
MIRLLKKFHRTTTGTAAIEFAIISPVLVMVLVGGSWIGFQLNSRLALQADVATGMQYAMTRDGATAADVEAVIRFSLGSVPADITTERFCRCNGTKQSCTTYCSATQEVYLSAIVTERADVGVLGRDMTFQSQFEVLTGYQP